MCEDCFTSKTSPNGYRHTMQSFTAGEPMERMAMDIGGPFTETKLGNKYVYVIQNYFTKYVCIIAVVNHHADTLATKLVNEVFCKIGLPGSLHSDRGTEFLSHLFREICILLHSERTATTPWQPQSDGKIERL